MKVRALDPDHDWLFGRGKNDYLVGNRMVAQMISTRVLSFLGDCFFDVPAGIDWFNLLGGKDRIALNLAIRTVILNTPNILSLDQLSISRDSARKLSVQYAVTTVFHDHLSAGVGLLLTESGDVLITEDGDEIHA